jgi:hypothetical protein
VLPRKLTTPSCSPSSIRPAEISPVASNGNPD